MLKIIYKMLIGGVAIGAFAAGVIFALPVKTTHGAKVVIGGASLGIEIANTPASREKGLGGRDELGANSGMLFLFDMPARYGIWMKDMRFPIDIFWIRKGVIVSLTENAPAPIAGTPDRQLPQYLPDADADMILEVNAGFAAAHRVHIGDRVDISGMGQAQLSNTAATFSEPVVQEITTAPKGSEYFIETIREHPTHGKNLVITGELPQSDGYRKFTIQYRVGATTIGGIMNVPRAVPPPHGFPILILNHGLIASDIYFSGRGSAREQDYFTRHGYVTIHPDYRGLASSTPNTAVHHDFYAGYTEDVSGLVDAVKESSFDFLDANRIGMWGHSMGGGIAERVMVARTDIRAFVLFAPIAANAEENFFELPTDEVSWLRDTYGYGDEGKKIFDQISPINYFQYISAPVQIHHGTGDTAVPIAFSKETYAALEQAGKQAELYIYPNEPHEFIANWSLAAARALQFFDRYVKR